MTLSRGHALYEGVVWHERAEPSYRFSQKLDMAWIDLLDVESLDSISLLFSTKRFRPVQLRRKDFLGNKDHDVAEEVRDLIENSLGFRPTGRIFALLALRTWGWCFNPLSVYFACDDDGELIAEVLDVRNTPWHERHPYVLDRREGQETFSFPKAFHVSPFFPMGLSYLVQSPEPSEELRLKLTLRDPNEHVVFAAGYEGTRRALDAAALRSLLWKSPSQRISLGIYTHAFRLRRRGARFYPHPKKLVSSSTAQGGVQ